VENVDFSQFDQTTQDNIVQSRLIHDPLVTKVSRARLSMNHTLDEIETEQELEQSADAEEPKQRPDGMWDCAHKCKNKQT